MYLKHKSEIECDTVQMSKGLQVVLDLLRVVSESARSEDAPLVQLVQVPLLMDVVFLSRFRLLAEEHHD